MTECITIDVSEQDSGSGDGGAGGPTDDGSPEVTTLSAPNSINSGEEFVVSYQVCCNNGSCPHAMTLYVGSDEVYSDDLSLTNECTSGQIGVTIEGNGDHTLTLTYGNRSMDKVITVEGEGGSGNGSSGGGGDTGDGVIPEIPDFGDGSGGDTPNTEPQLPLGLSRNQALAIGGGALGIIVLSSDSSPGPTYAPFRGR